MSFICDDEMFEVLGVFGIDANTLYLWTTSLPMPMGTPRIYRFKEAINKMKLSKVDEVSEKQIAWLSELEKNFHDLCYAVKNGKV